MSTHSHKWTTTEPTLFEWEAPEWIDDSAVKQRFEEHTIEPDNPDENPGCKQLDLVPDKDGYGQFYINNKTYRANRVAYILYNQTGIPSELDVLHSCHNKWCVAPEHLRLGNNSDNMLDAVEQGTHYSAKGEDMHLNKLTEEEARQVKRLTPHLLGPGKPFQSTVAEKLGVDKRTISSLLREKSWKHLTVEPVDDIEDSELLSLNDLYGDTQLTVDEVREIKQQKHELQGPGKPYQTTVGEKYGVSRDTIHEIVHEERWEYVTVENTD